MVINCQSGPIPGNRALKKHNIYGAVNECARVLMKAGAEFLDATPVQPPRLLFLLGHWFADGKQVISLRTGDARRK